MNRQENTKREEVSNWKLWTVVVITVGVFLGFSVYFVYFYFQYIGLEELTKSDSTFGTFGDYLGGTIGTITAIAVFIATLIIIFLQKEELKATRDELEKSRTAQELQAKLFQQQQFETTFFTLLDKMNDCKEVSQFSSLLRLVYDSVKDYCKKYKDNNEISDKDIENKYRDILKSYLGHKIGILFLSAPDLYEIFGSQGESSYISVIENWSLFGKNFVIDENNIDDNDEDFLNEIVNTYDIKAFEGNNFLIKFHHKYNANCINK